MRRARSVDRGLQTWRFVATYVFRDDRPPHSLLLNTYRLAPNHPVPAGVPQGMAPRLAHRHVPPTKRPRAARTIGFQPVGPRATGPQRPPSTDISRPKGHKPRRPEPPICSLTEILRKGPRTSLAGARASLSTLHFLYSTLSAPGRRTSVSAPLDLHRKTSEPLGRRENGIEQKQDPCSIGDGRGPPRVGRAGGSGCQTSSE